MLESTIEFLSNVDWQVILLAGFFFTFLENLFPPAPGDTVIVFLGSLVAIGNIDFISLLATATAGSIIGFATMFLLGKQFGEGIIDNKKIKFINRKQVAKADKWFKRWGYYLIVANRFLSGTRAVISFVAGISKLKFWLTILLSTVSALIWNSLLIFLGFKFGENWRIVDEYLHKYGTYIGPAIGIIILIIIIRWVKLRKNKKSQKNES